MQRGVDDAAAMTECLETFAAVVGSHSAVPDSSEGEVSVGGLYDGVVDTGSARCGVLYHVACPFFAAGKVVEGEGLFPVVDVFDTVVDVVEREYGEYGAEDFVGEQGGLRGYVGEQRGGYVSVGGIACASAKYRAVREERRQAVEMPSIDDTGIIGALLWIFAVLTGDFVTDIFCEFVLDFAMYHEVVGGYAGLSAVEELAPYDAACGGFQIGIVIDDTGTFSSQFECDGGEVTRCGLHDVTPVFDTSCVEDVIEPFLQE